MQDVSIGDPRTPYHNLLVHSAGGVQSGRTFSADGSTPTTAGVNNTGAAIDPSLVTRFERTASRAGHNTPAGMPSPNAFLPAPTPLPSAHHHYSPGTSHELLLLQAQQQIRELLPCKEQSLQLQSEVVLLRERMKQKEAECATLQTMLRREHSERAAAVAEAEGRRETDVARWRSEVDRLTRALETQKRSAEEAARRAEQAQGALDRIEAQRQDDHRVAGAVADDARRKIEQLERITRQYATAEATAKAAAERSVELEQRLRRSDEELDGMRHMTLELQSKLASAIHEKTLLQEKVADLSRTTSVMEALRRDSAELSTIREELLRTQKELGESVQATVKYRRGMEEAELSVQRLSATNAALTDELRGSLAKRSALETEVEELRRSLGDHNAALQQLTAEREELRRLRSEMKELRDDSAAAEREARVALAEITAEAASIWRSVESAAIYDSVLSRPDEAPGRSPSKGAVSVHRDPSTASSVFGPVRAAIDRLTHTLRDEHHRTIEARRAELEMRGRVADLEDELQRVSTSASQQQMTRQRHEQDLHRYKEAAEDYGSALRAERRESVAFIRRITDVIREHVAAADTSLDSLGDLSFASIDEHSDTSLHPDAVDRSSSVIRDTVLRGILRVCEASAALRKDRDRLSQQLSQLQRDAAAAKETFEERASALELGYRRESDELRELLAVLKDSLTKEVVRANEIAKSRDAAESERDDTAVLLKAAEHQLTEVREQLTLSESRLRDVREHVTQLESDVCDAASQHHTDTQRMEEMQVALRRLQQERDSVLVMLGCAVAAISRLRSDLTEVVVQRKLLMTWTSELERCLTAVESCAAEIANSNAHAAYGPLARFRVASIAVLSAVRLRRLVAPPALYRNAVGVRSRFRAAVRGDGVRCSMLTNVAFPARDVPVPPVDMLVSAIHPDSSAEAIVEQLLVIFAAPSEPPSASIRRASPGRALGESAAMAVSEQRRQHTALLQQLQGTAIDYTLLRRLSVGLCALPVDRSVRTPLQRCRHSCTAIRDVARRYQHKAQSAEQRASSQADVVGSLRHRVSELEHRCTEYEQRKYAVEMPRDARKVTETASDAHDASIAAAAAAAERKRADAAIAELARREAQLRETRLRLQGDQQLLATAESLRNRISQGTSPGVGRRSAAGSPVLPEGWGRFPATDAASSSSAPLPRPASASRRNSGTSRRVSPLPPASPLSPQSATRRGEATNYMRPTVWSANRANENTPSNATASRSNAVPAAATLVDDDVLALITSLDNRLDQALLPPHHTHHRQTE